MKKLCLLLLCSLVAAEQEPILVSDEPVLAKSYASSVSWPSHSAWDTFNGSIGGRLLSAHPPGRSCYAPNYSRTLCRHAFEAVKSSRSVAEMPLGVSYPFFTGLSCQPTSGSISKGKCTGKWPSYIVRAETVQDVAQAVNFARKWNIRVTVKGTGHDFLGRNIGSGSLLIWTRHLKGIRVEKDWTGKGPVVHIAAGETGGDVKAAVNAVGRLVVTGADDTVGTAGGWALGGGHGPLSNTFGLGVDNVLEHEVVLANGSIVLANPEKNQDLYWALRGGGGGTFGIVTRITTKTHEQRSLHGVMLTVTPQKEDATGKEKWIDALVYLLTKMPLFTEFGLSGYPVIYNGMYSGDFAAPGRTMHEVQNFIQPIAKALENMGVDVSMTFTHDSKYKMTDNVGIAYLMSSRLVSREALTPPTLKKALISLIKEADIIQPFPVAGGAVATKGKDEMALNPAWRDAVLHMIVNKRQPLTSANEIQGNWERYTETILKSLDTLGMNGAAYLNEASAYEPDWKRTFWGPHYARLLEVKKQVDPENIFWCRRCVGSEVYKEGDDGRLYV
jgi:hypothetical protein